MKKKILLLAVLLMLAFGGCIVGTDESGRKTYSVDPNIAEKFEQGAAVGEVILALLYSLGWPVGGVIAGYLGHALQTWKLVKPKLVKAQSEAEMYHTAALTTSIGLEEFRKAYPEYWKELAALLDKAKDDFISPKDQLKIENVIRGLRGLAPKK